MVYPNEYIFDWVKLNDTLLPDREDFYSHLNKKDITDANYRHAKRVCKNFEIKNLDRYHDLYFQSDTLLSADLFNNFQNIGLNPNKSLKVKKC